MDLFKLSAKLVLDKSEYDKGINDAESKAYKTGQAIGTGLQGIGGAFGKAITGIAKVTVAGIAMASTAVGALVKQSVSEYAEYQQTLGGVQKLYGTAGMSIEQYAESVGKSVDEVKGKYAELTKAQEMVLANAENAYMTAGLSTQAYMEQATSFSASLINSLGGDTVKAAEQTDVAMRAIADNYNTFGGDMQNIQNAYQGFAKGNYMMLDNLKLGYGGTKTEMERLIADANEYGKAMGLASDLSIDSFSDIVTAIDLVQQKQGIAGTTAREASTTISGSLGMVKSAWDNLVAGISNPDADISKLIDNLVKSLVGYTDEAGNEINGFIDNILPTISQATTGIVQLVSEIVPKIAEELPGLLEEVLPMIIETGVELFNGLAEALPEMMQVLFDQLPLVISSIVDSVVTLLPMIIELGLQLITSLAEGIVEALPELVPALIDTVKKIVEILSNPDTLMNLVDAAVQITVALANGLIEALPELIPAIAEMIVSIVNALTQPDNLALLIMTAIQLVLALAEGIIKAIPDILVAIGTLIVNLVTAIYETREQFKEKALELIGKMIEGIKSMFTMIKEKGTELIAKLILGIIAKYTEIKEKGKELVDKVKDGFMDKVEGAKQWGKDLIDNFINGLKEKWENLKSTVSDIAGSIKDILGFSEPKLGPLSNFHTYAPDMMDLFMQGINDNKDRLLDTVENAFDFRDMIVSPSLNISDNTGQIGYNVGGNDLYSMLEQILAILPQLANNKIVLDTGVLVGETATQYDEALGKILVNKQRSV